MNDLLVRALVAYGAREMARNSARQAKLAVEAANEQRTGWPSHEAGDYFDQAHRSAQQVLLFCTEQKIQAERAFKWHRATLEEQAPEHMDALEAFVIRRLEETRNG